MIDKEDLKFETYLKHFSYTDSHGNVEQFWKSYRRRNDMKSTGVKKSKGLWVAWVAVFLAVIGAGWFGFTNYQTKQTQESIAKGETLIVTLVIGDVQVQRMGSDEWRDADIDDHLQMGDKVKTGDDAVCEIQMLNRGLFRVESSSEILMKTLKNVDGKVQSRLKLAKGSIGLKPKKLKKGENFEVETRTAVAAVRGTKFSVTSDADGNTKIAVVEGKVAVSPRIKGLEAAEKKGQITKKASKILAEKVAAPVNIVPGEEIKMDQKKVALLNQAVVKSIEKVAAASGPITEDKLVSTNAGTTNVALLKDVQKQVVKEIKAQITNENPADTTNGVEAVVNLSDLVAQKQAISEESKQQLEKISEDRILKTLKTYRLKVESKVSGAKIVFNGESPVQTVDRILAKDASVQVKVSKEGFEPWATNLTLTSDVVFKVDLKPIEKPASNTNVQMQSTETQAMTTVESTSSTSEAASSEVVAQVSSEAVSSTTVAQVSSDAVKLPGSVEWKRSIALNGDVSESVRFGDKVALTLGSDLYILSLNGKILARTVVLKNGKKLTRPVVAGNRIYVGSESGGLFAYSSSGKLIWKSMEAGRQTYGRIYPVISGKNLIYASYDKGIQIFTLDGKLVRSFDHTGVLFATPVVTQDGKVVIYGNNNGEVAALQLADGKQLWKKQVMDERIIYPLLLSGNTVVFLSRTTGNLKAISTADGSDLWSKTYASLKRTALSPFVSAGKLVLVNSGGNGVLLVSAKSGSLLYQSEDVAVSTVPVLKGGWLYVGMENGKVHAFNYRTKKSWSYQVGSAVRVLVDQGENLYAMDTAGMVKLNK